MMSEENMKPMSYAKSVKSDPVGAIQAEMHDLCSFITENKNEAEKLAGTKDQKEKFFQLGRFNAYMIIESEIRKHDLWT